jgi:hypothetical protein
MEVCVCVCFSDWIWSLVSYTMSSGSVHGHLSAQREITPFQQEAEITRLTLMVMQSCMLHLCYLFAVLVNSRKDYTEKLYLGLLVCVSIQDILSGAIDLCPYCSNTVPRRTWWVEFSWQNCIRLPEPSKIIPENFQSLQTTPEVCQTSSGVQEPRIYKAFRCLSAKMYRKPRENNTFDNN